MRVTSTTLRRLIREAVLEEMGWRNRGRIPDAELPEMSDEPRATQTPSDAAPRGPSYLQVIDLWLSDVDVDRDRLQEALQIWIDEIKPGGVVFLNADDTVELDGMLLMKDDIANIFLG